MPDMKIAVRLRRKAGFHASIPFAGTIVFLDDAADEVGSRDRVVHCVLMFQGILLEVMKSIVLLGLLPRLL
jgi:hypothetical protein